jgi:hypothetical protein
MLLNATQTRPVWLSEINDTNLADVRICEVGAPLAHLI